ncbi:MAG: hypothetical protein QM503_15115 [Bacteroidota bacterium]
MKDELKYIDDFYKKNLVDLDEKATTKTWNNLRWTLFWIRYKWVIGVSAFVILLGLVSVIYVGTNNTPKITTNIIDNNKPEIFEITNSITKIEKSHKEIFTSSIEQDNAVEYNSSTTNSNITTLVLEQIPANPKEQPIEKSNNNYNIKKPVVDYNLMLTEINNRWENIFISSKPDSVIFGYNKRANVLSTRQKKHSLYANIYAGPAFSLSEISGYNSEYLAVRNSNESNKYGWSLGIDLKLHLKNWVITSGLNYSVYNQSRSYSHNYQEYSEEDSYYQYDTTWVWFFDPPNYGVPIMVDVDSSWIDVYNTVTVDNSGINQLKYFEIPLLVGYQVNANLFSIEINTGISAGFLLYSNVKVPHFTNTDEIVSASEMNNIMFNFMANASVYYHISSSTSIFISPYYKKNLQSIFSNDYPINQQFSTYGLNLGIRLRF